MTGIVEAYAAYTIMLGLLLYHAKTLFSEIKSLETSLEELDSSNSNKDE
ncbi:MAG: hypothetical protein QF365_03585 [Candidatus Thalassarchaeaceae archaeon]|jgi:hypothetical protein|nr:hypothetical protein [Candidatus Thalassarchaeaceae archaeon]MDP6318157.1 hypothetical protein [Candidatus Thalassarchaeaceae archaeon]HIH80223.1 hypothetical protein [Candidatus Thalassarchaeaceae archaeon]HJM30569.1 hypothetical protein [Candidatus Thalassarchaeaceae archaeon]HJN70158.1 hypothetical protein [Candidatus Thalassarchaeaceae archaeon]